MATGTNTGSVSGAAQGNASVAYHEHQISDIKNLETRLAIIDSMQPLLVTCNNLLLGNNNAQAEISTIKEQIAAIQAAIELDAGNGVESDLERLSTKVTGLELNISTFLAAYKNYSAAIADNAAKFSTIDGAISLLDGRIKEIDAFISNLGESSGSADLSELVTIVSKVNEIITEHTAKLDQTTLTLVDIKASTSTTNATLAELAAKSINLEGRLTDAESSIETQLQSLNGFSNKVSGFSSEVNALTSEVEAVKSNFESSLDELQANLPTLLSVTRVNESAEASELDYADYTITLEREATEEEKEENPSTEKVVLSTADLQLTNVLNTLIQQSYIGCWDAINGINTRLSNLTSWVASLDSQHELAINNLYVYRAADLYSDVTPKDSLAWFKANIMNNSAFSIEALADEALLNTVGHTPESLRGTRFYIVFETAYPISNPQTGTVDKPVSLGFPNFLSGSAVYSTNKTERIYCTPLGIPSVNKAFYVLHDGISSSEDGVDNYLTPFRIGSGEMTPTDNGLGSFGNNFILCGDYPFMLEITDPVNSNKKALKAASLKVAYFCYFGTFNEATFNADALSSFTKITDLTAPAAYINWSSSNYNKNTSNYYYYLVPTTSLPANSAGDPEETCWLRFETGLGTGGWQLIDASASIGGVSYAVFRTTHALTFCPPTTVWIAES